MSSDNFDNKIKDSLENGSPAFDESSWHKMETMLDKHMPQKKDDRRKLILFFFLFLLLGGGTVFLINRSTSEKDTNQITYQTDSSDIKSKTGSVNTVEKNEKASSISPISDNIINTPSSVVNNSISNKKPIIPGNKTSIVSAISKPANIEKKLMNKNEAVRFSIKPFQEKVISDTKSTVETKTTVESKSTVNESISIIQQEPVKSTEATNPENENIKKEIKKENEELSEKNKPGETKTKSAKKKQSFIKNILFNVSAGPDISSVGNNTGKVKIMLGAGLGYKISERLTIRSGLFASRKIYTADPGDYNPPSNFWAYYPNLKTIDADCKVLELPVNLDYKFGFTKTHNWFVSAGASSFFMKKEVYNYYYKPAYSPQYVYYSRTYENKNKHYFSILNLSGGFSKKISTVLTLQAEPYMKIALKGVGYGKVNLNSAGLLVTAIIQPFQSKK